MKKVRYFLKGKENGYVHVASIMAVLMMMIAAFTVLGLGYRKLTFLKYKMDNGVILSALAANVADLYSIATYGQTAFETSVSGAYGSGNDEIAVRRACAEALDIAFLRFTDAMERNLPVVYTGTGFQPSPDSGIAQITLKQFRLYNVLGEDVYICELGRNVEKIVNGKGFCICGSTGDVVTDSAIYVSVTFKIYAMGHYYEIPIQQYVDITESNREIL